MPLLSGCFHVVRREIFLEKSTIKFKESKNNQKTKSPKYGFDSKNRIRGVDDPLQEKSSQLPDSIAVYVFRDMSSLIESFGDFE